MYRVVKSANKLSGRWINPDTPNYREEGTPKGVKVREDYYSGKYDSGANDDGSTFEQDEDVLKVLADLVGTEMYLQSYKDDVWYKINGSKGAYPDSSLPARVRVAKFVIEHGTFEFVEENMTSLRSLAEELDNPLIIRTLEEAVKESM